VEVAMHFIHFLPLLLPLPLPFLSLPLPLPLFFSSSSFADYLFLFLFLFILSLIPSVKQNLAIIPANVTWGGQSNMVFAHLAVDFMQPVWSTVDYLLENKVNVIPYSGNLDLICCTPGTLDWVSKLKWKGLPEWMNMTRHAMTIDQGQEVVAFHQKHEHFHFYTVLDAGHMGKISCAL
jgi:carboxypeptidase C (cathepsin A)